MVTKKQFSRLFPGVPYKPSTLDKPGLHENFAIPQLRPGVVNSINKMADKLLAEYQLDKVQDYDLYYDYESQQKQLPSWISGWFHVDSNTKVDNPLGKTLILDCETFVKGGSVPVMAVALSEKGLFLWKPAEIGDLITVTPGTLVIAHSSSYEACRIKQAYTGEALFLDTLSMAKQCFGYASGQTWAVRTDKTPKPRFVQYGSRLGLAAIYEFLGLGTLDKSTRDTFVNAETIQDIEQEWDELLHYNFLDVIATARVFSKLFPIYTQKAPNSTSIWGLINNCSYRLPLTPEWGSWFTQVEQVYQDISDDISNKLQVIADNWVSEGFDQNNPWKRRVDWTIKPKARKLKGYPEWYRKAGDLTIKSQLSHYLLKMEYLGEPVEYVRGYGWGSEAGKVPHPSGKGNVGVLFTKDLQELFDRGDISSKNPECKEILKMAMQLTYWTSVRNRVIEQCIHPDYNGYNWCIPQTGGGTITGRVTDPLWLTTCDAKPNRVGTELKSRITAPPGYKLLTADFSSQEMKIAWMLADSINGVSGSNPMSKAGYLGDKSRGTDAHSMTARVITERMQRYSPGAEFSRDAAKGLNFAMLYMGGQKTVADGIYRNSTLSLEQSMEIAKDTLTAIRGKVQYFYGTKEYSGGSNSDSYTAIDNICNQDYPRTPLLHREMSDPLCPAVVGSDYYTTRANWVIQGSARDMLDILTTAYSFMCRHFSIDSKIIWSRHDEVIALVPDSQYQLAAEILQVAHVYSWAALHEQLGLFDMPNLGLLFEGVEVDTTVRKNPSDPCVTPSSPQSVTPGFTLELFNGIDTW